MTLAEAKSQVSSAYLGKYGIHGVGTGGNRVTVYSEKCLSKDIQKEISDSVNPHLTEFLRADAPHFAFF